MNTRRRKESAPPDGGVDVLETSPFEGDLEDELKPKPQRLKLPGPTLWLATGVVLIAGFLGGIQAQKAWGTSSSSSPAGAAPDISSMMGRMGGSGLPSMPGGQGPNGDGSAATDAGTVGKIKSVKGDTIYIQTSTGVVHVKISGTTKITVSATAKTSDLKTGATVTVQWAKNADGTVTAQTVAQR